MTAWFSRNLKPIAAVLVASAVVVGLFEAIDALSTSAPVVAETDGAADEFTGVATLAGLIKVSLFLVVGALISTPLRRRFRSAPPKP